MGHVKLGERDRVGRHGRLNPKCQRRGSAIYQFGDYHNLFLMKITKFIVVIIILVIVFLLLLCGFLE